MTKRIACVLFLLLVSGPVLEAQTIYVLSNEQIGNDDFCPYMFDVKAKAFVKDPAGGGGVKIAIGPGNIPWMINSDGRIWKRGLNPEKKLTYLEVQKDAKATDIVGSQNGIWILSNEKPGGENGKDYSPYFFDGGVFKKDPAGGAGVKIAIGPGGTPWIVNSEGRIWKRGTNIKGQLTYLEIQKDAKATDIAGSQHGIWILSNEKLDPEKGKDYAPYVLEGSVFKKDPAGGAGTKIAIGPDGIPWMINSDLDIWKRGVNEKNEPTWIQQPGKAVEIAAGESVEKKTKNVPPIPYRPEYCVYVIYRGGRVYILRAPCRQ